VPVTVAEKLVLCPIATEAAAGVMLTAIAGVAVIVKVALAVFVASAVLVAATVTAAGVGTFDGAV